MRIPDGLYQVLKWTGLIFLPACAWLVSRIAPAWGWSNVDAIVTTFNATGTFIGVLIGVSTLEYYKQDGGEE